MSDLDISLVKRARKGDEQAFYQLMLSHKQQLYRMALSYLKNEEDAIEAVQETTFRAFRGMKKLRKPAYFTTWLMRILLNYCHDEVKKNKRFIYNDELIHSLEGSSSHSLLEVEEAINHLEEKYRNVIILKYLQDLKIDEIAEILQCPQGTVKTWLRKALELLRQYFNEKEDGFHV